MTWVALPSSCLEMVIPYKHNYWDGPHLMNHSKHTNAVKPTTERSYHYIQRQSCSMWCQAVTMKDVTTQTGLSPQSCAQPIKELLSVCLGCISMFCYFKRYSVKSLTTSSAMEQCLCKWVHVLVLLCPWYTQSCQWFHPIPLISWQWRAKKCCNTPENSGRKKSANK